MSRFEWMGSPVDYGGVKLKNRIIFAPTTMGMSQEECIRRIGRIAAGGCAMIIIGDVPVLRGGFGPSLYTKKGFAYYRRLAEAAHREGSRICAQLHQSDSNLKAMVKYIPGVLGKKISRDELRVYLNQEVGPYVSGLPAEKLRRIASAFGEAALLAAKAGFDMVQVHGDRMCGSLSSLVFNSRKDRYGGTLENRARFAAEAVEAVRRRLPDMPIDFKLAVRQEQPHYGNAGVLKEELGAFIPLLERAGVTSFHVALANHSRLEDTIPAVDHPYFGAEGCFLSFCDAVRQHTSLPVCGVGGLTRPEFVEEQLAAGRIDCAAMSRALIADPDWVDKALNGREQEIRRCIRCNRKCLGGILKGMGVHCIYEGGNGT